MENEKMSFDELFAEHRITEQERAELVWFLAQFRMKATLKALLPEKWGYGVKL